MQVWTWSDLGSERKNQRWIELLREQEAWKKPHWGHWVMEEYFKVHSERSDETQGNCNAWRPGEWSS